MALRAAQAACARAAALAPLSRQQGAAMARFTAGDGTDLYYEDQGSGLPVLCLAGLTRNSRDFDHLAPHVPHVRLIRMDYRGRGLSAWPGPSSYTVQAEAADALALLDHLGIARAAVIGTSRGGLIGLWLCHAAKDRLLGLCLNDIGPEIEPRGLDIIRGYLGRNPVQKTWEEAALARARLWTGFHGVPHARWLAEVRGHYDETPEGLVIRYDPRLRQAVFGDEGAAPAVQPQASLWPLFDAAAGLPLCLIRGETSDLLSRATTAEMCRRRPDMTRAEVPGRGHVPFLDEPEALAALARWLGEMQ